VLPAQRQTSGGGVRLLVTPRGAAGAALLGLRKLPGAIIWRGGVRSSRRLLGNASGCRGRAVPPVALPLCVCLRRLGGLRRRGRFWGLLLAPDPRGRQPVKDEAAAAADARPEPGPAQVGRQPDGLVVEI